MKGSGLGVLVDMIVGLIGALIGGFISSHLFIGAVILTVILRFITGSALDGCPLSATESPEAGRTCDLSLASPPNPASHLLTRAGVGQECRIIPMERITVAAGSFMKE
jgi:hypothetical protein